MEPLFDLPTNFIASTTAVMAQLFQTFDGLLTLIIGTLIALLVIAALVSMLRH